MEPNQEFDREAESELWDDPEDNELDFYVAPDRRRYRRHVSTEPGTYHRYVWDVGYHRGRAVHKTWPPSSHYERWQDTAVRPLPLGPELTSRQERIQRIMEEPRGGTNAGRATPMGDAAHERRRPLELGPEGAARSGFLIAGGWHVEEPRHTGEPPGRPRIEVELIVRDQDRLLELVGVDRPTFARLFRQGPKASADREARVWVEDAIARLIRDGSGFGIQKALMDIYGCSRSTLDRCVRAAKARESETTHKLRNGEEHPAALKRES